MDFSTLFSSGNSLYIIGGVVLVIVLIEVVVIFSKKSPVNQALSAAVAPATPSVGTETQAVAKEESILPSTAIAETSPAIMEQNTAAVSLEPVKAAIPPLSSWKPSEVAAPIKVEDGVENAASNTSIATEEKPVQ